MLPPVTTYTQRSRPNDRTAFTPAGTTPLAAGPSRKRESHDQSQRERSTPPPPELSSPSGLVLRIERQLKFSSMAAARRHNIPFRRVQALETEKVRADSDRLATVAYFCNNVDMSNWGCRATSLALHACLAGPGVGIESFSRRFTANPIVRLPVPDRPELVAMVEGWALQRAYDTRAASVVEWTDVVHRDPAISVRRLQRAARHSHRIAAALEAVSTASAVVINGEGSMIFRTPPRRDLLFQMTIARFAQDVGVPVHYVNAVASPCPRTGENLETIEMCKEVLAGCASVILRDPISFEYLRQKGFRSSNLRSAPDALFTWAVTHSEQLHRRPTLAEIEPYPERPAAYGQPAGRLPAQYLCVSAASLPVGGNRVRWTERYTDLVRSLEDGLGLPVVLIVPDDGDRFLYEVGKRTRSIVVRVETGVLSGAAILANAEAYISGRYHPAIMASLGGTPLVSFAANSHKLDGLRALLGTSPEPGISVDDPQFIEITLEAAKAVLHPSSDERSASVQHALALGRQAMDVYGSILNPNDR